MLFALSGKNGSYDLSQFSRRGICLVQVRNCYSRWRIVDAVFAGSKLVAGDLARGDCDIEFLVNLDIWKVL